MSASNPLNRNLAASCYESDALRVRQHEVCTGKYQHWGSHLKCRVDELANAVDQGPCQHWQSNTWLSATPFLVYKNGAFRHLNMHVAAEVVTWVFPMSLHMHFILCPGLASILRLSPVKVHQCSTPRGTGRLMAKRSQQPATSHALVVIFKLNKQILGMERC